VPFWPGLRCSRTREVEDLGERWGGVARAEGPAGAIDEARYGGPAGLGSWTADADSYRRPPDNTTYESGSSLRTLVMRQLALCQPTR
jgi:hypothetical protein